jgi:hypothetical protein
MTSELKMTQEEWIDQYLSDIEKNYHYTEEEIKLIKAVRTSNFSNHDKMTFGLLLMNYGTEQLRVRNLEDRLQLSYKGEGVEDYLNKIVQFNPKLRYVSLEAGESGRDEKDDCSCSFNVPIEYDENMEKYFQNAKEVEDKLKQVLRIVLVDAKKMRI